MIVNLNILEELKTLSLSGTHPKVWIAAALVHRNKIISYGVNQMKTHPYQRKYGRNSEAIYWHAETSAIYIASVRLGFAKFKNSTLYISRLKYDSPDKEDLVSGIAKPCDGCMRCINDYGIKNVIYTLDKTDDSENFGIITL